MVMDPLKAPSVKCLPHSWSKFLNIDIILESEKNDYSRGDVCIYWITNLTLNVNVELKWNSP